MPIEETLRRVEDDLAAGRRALARQRLRSLVGAFPQDLGLRLRLAALYRADGDLAQAGRWSYLDGAADPAEVAAFERAYSDPFARMRALSWRAEESAASTPAARERLGALRLRAEADAGGPVSWLDPRRPDPPVRWTERVFAGGCVVAFAVGLILVITGLMAFLVRGIEVVRGWF